VSTTSKEWTTPDSRNTPSTTNLEEEDIVDAPGNNGIASMPEQVKRPNPWRKMMMMMYVFMNLHPVAAEVVQCEQKDGRMERRTDMTT